MRAPVSLAELVKADAIGVRKLGTDDELTSRVVAAASVSASPFNGLSSSAEATLNSSVGDQARATVGVVGFEYSDWTVNAGQLLKLVPARTIALTDLSPSLEKPTAPSALAGFCVPR